MDFEDDRLQSLLNEVENLNKENQSLAKDNKELRDLCCFLDDDRQKSKRLAREWQKFGEHTAKIMREELDNYRQKLRLLDSRQQELIKDNYELKDLCIYLDEERNLVDGISCPHCLSLILPSRIGLSSVNNFTMEENNPAQELGNQSFEIFFEDKTCGDSISSSNETCSSVEDVVITTTSATKSTSSLPANEYVESSAFRDFDRNSAKIKEVISIYEHTHELADQRDNLRAILDEMCSVVLKSLEMKFEQK